ncbi:MAG: radical SAM protein [Lachnospiraceae bacterium]|nr:radical SAM protein [Lachnospiraceae bacterium]
MNVLLSNIQRFSLQDGPGIRTTVFLKGCWLKCPWCSNPENIKTCLEEYVWGNEIKVFGFEMSIDELEKEILKDKKYYGDKGGVTYSGGEALLQIKSLEPMLKSLKEKRINQCIETSLYAPKENLEMACKYIDEYIVDAKILIEKSAKDIIGGELSIYLDNIKYLANHNNSIVLRVPLVNPYTVSEQNLFEIRKLVEEYQIAKIEIFRVHNLGEKKYSVLGRTQDVGLIIGEKAIEEIREYLGKEKVRVICI